MNEMRKKRQKKITVFALCVVLVSLFAVTSCDKLRNLRVNELAESVVKNTEIWECVPEQDVIITLIIDSIVGEVYIHTIPKDLGYPYLFTDGGDNNATKYLLIGDTMYFDADSNGIPIPNNYSGNFIRTMLSPDRMRLVYGGVLPTIPYVRDYLFVKN